MAANDRHTAHISEVERERAAVHLTTAPAASSPGVAEEIRTAMDVLGMLR